MLHKLGDFSIDVEEEVSYPYGWVSRFFYAQVYYKGELVRDYQSNENCGKSEEELVAELFNDFLEMRLKDATNTQ